MAVFEGDTLEDARRIIARYPYGRERSAIMPLLYVAQSLEGHVTREGLREVAGLLEITTAEVEAVASFYTMYRLRPTGEHLVNVCTNLACQLRGAKDVYEAAHQAAGMAHGQEISDDGLLTVHEEECLGVCDFAPAVQIDFANHDNVSPDRMRELIAQLRAGEVPEPARGPKMQSFRHASRVLAGLEEVGA
jgi:NADH:ubiquinone oxidoreductase 24 kD subunit